MKSFLLATFFLLLAQMAYAQYDLRRDAPFFHNRAKDYSTWLYHNELGHFFDLAKTGVYPDKVRLLLRASFSGEKAGDSLRAVWSELRRQYYVQTGAELHVAMLSKMAFQMDLPLDSAEIVLFVPNSEYYIRIYGEREGQRLTARWEDYGNKGMGSGNIKVPVEQLSDVFRSGKAKLDDSPGVDLARVRRSVRAFFRDNYQNKGTDWFWKARIDSTSAVYNDFSFTVTHISREVLKSHNFFELHQIDISIAEGMDGLEISWSFQAKYGGGLIFPPRDDSNDYHDFETSPYKYQFDKYQAALFKRLEAYLKKV